MVESSYAEVELGEARGNALDGKLAFVWANQTLELSAQNSGSLTATELRTKVRDVATVGGFNILLENNRC